MYIYICIYIYIYGVRVDGAAVFNSRSRTTSQFGGVIAKPVVCGLWAGHTVPGRLVPPFGGENRPLLSGAGDLWSVGLCYSPCLLSCVWGGYAVPARRCAVGRWGLCTRCLGKLMALGVWRGVFYGSSYLMGCRLMAVWCVAYLLLAARVNPSCNCS